jgi:hypothetical protein
MCSSKCAVEACLLTSELPPLFKAYGFDYKATSDNLYLAPEARALPWEEIKRQIYCKKKPFAFSWWLAESEYMSGHVMVAVGYKELGGELYVDYLDPSPPVDSENPIPHDGRLVTLTYDEYIKGSFPKGHIYGTAFYDISPEGGE